MAYTPTSPEGIALQKLRRMVALSETFQEVCHGGYDRALQNVCYIETRDKEGPAAVVAIIDGGDGQVAGGDAVYTRGKVNLHLYVRVEADAAIADVEDQKLKGIDTLAKIISEVMDLAGVDDEDDTESHLNIVMRQTPIYDEIPEEIRETVGHFFFAETTFSVGDGD